MAEKVSFARLNNANYQTWKMRMEMMLITLDLWHTVKDAKPASVTDSWTKADQKAKAMIILFIEDNQLNLVKDAGSALDVWNILKKYHEKATVTSRVSLLKKLCSFNYVDGTNMEKHLFDIEELFDRLTCAGQKLEDSLKVAMIYRSLPESYNGLVTALESRSDADQTIAFVKQRLLDEYQRRVELSGEHEERVLKTLSRGKRERVCYYCRKPGHFQKDCRLLQQKDEGESRNTKRDVPKAKQVAEKDPPICFGIGGDRRKGCWYVDSGCSSHMTSSKMFFSELDESVKMDVFLADGSVTRSAGIGEGLVKCISGDGKVNEVMIKEVLYIPKLDSGLISVRKLAQKGLEMKFDASRCEIVSQKGKVEAVADLHGNLYALRVAEDSKHCEHRDPTMLNRIRANNQGKGTVLHDCGVKQQFVEREQPVEEEPDDSDDEFFDFDDYELELNHCGRKPIECNCISSSK